MSYTATWDYLRQLTVDAHYLEVVRTGHWLWIYDHLNIHLKVHHEREGNFIDALFQTTGLVKLLLSLT